MKTRELIAELMRADPSGNAEVEILVYVATKTYPAACVEPSQVTMGPWGIVRVSCSLPDGMTTMQRKIA